jgi:hypothetical protein
MGIIGRFQIILRVMKRAKRPIEAFALLRRRPPILFGVNMFEMSLLASGRVDGRLKALASIKTSALVGCPF